MRNFIILFDDVSSNLLYPTSAAAAMSHPSAEAQQQQQQQSRRDASDRNAVCDKMLAAGPLKQQQSLRRQQQHQQRLQRLKRSLLDSVILECILDGRPKMTSMFTEADKLADTMTDRDRPLDSANAHLPALARRTVADGHPAPRIEPRLARSELTRSPPPDWCSFNVRTP